MSVAFICDLCNKPFSAEEAKPNSVSFDCRDINGNFLEYSNEDKYRWHVCEKCRNEIMRSINLIIFRNKEESE